MNNYEYHLGIVYSTNKNCDVGDGLPYVSLGLPHCFKNSVSITMMAIHVAIHKLL